MKSKKARFSFMLGHEELREFNLNITGYFEYHYENYGEDSDGNRGERTLIIDDVQFDPLFDGKHLDEITHPDQYAYLLERAKESCYFE